MAFLFDTDAISEMFKRRPLDAYVAWLRTIPREKQFTSAVVVGELFKGAYRSDNPRYLQDIDRLVLPELTVLPYDVETARICGAVQAELEETGRVLADADVPIAATALFYDLELVSGNLRDFHRISGLRICTTLDEARRDGT